jgi:hypothetical protein
MSLPFFPPLLNDPIPVYHHATIVPLRPNRFDSQELAQLGLEDTVSDELPLLGDLGSHFFLLGFVGVVVDVDGVLLKC